MDRRRRCLSVNRNLGRPATTDGPPSVDMDRRLADRRLCSIGSGTRSLCQSCRFRTACRQRFQRGIPRDRPTKPLPSSVPTQRSYLCVRIFSAIRRSEIAFKHGALKALPLVSNSVFKVICLELFGHLTQHHEQSRRNTCYEHCGRRGAATSREPAQICASSRELSGVRAGCPDGKDGLDARDHSAQDSRRRPQS